MKESNQKKRRAESSTEGKDQKSAASRKTMSMHQNIESAPSQCFSDTNITERVGRITERITRQRREHPGIAENKQLRAAFRRPASLLTVEN
jgi:hypothetical protein